MVFGFSIGEVIFLMVGTVVLLGPKDLPIMARAVGRLTGRAVGYMQTARGQMDMFMEQSQASQVQKELRETMAQLDAIRHEIRTGMSIMQPGPLVRESLESSASHFQKGGSLRENGEKSPSGMQQATVIMRKFENALDRFADSSERQHGSKFEVYSQSSADLQSRATSYARFAGHPSMVEKSQEILRTHQMGTSQGSAPENCKEIPVLPISAVSMGLFPSRTGSLGGSDLVLESLAERKVAQQALEFLQQPEAATATDAEPSPKDMTDKP